ncbi:MFS transporter [Chondromyces crocatus]|uniref:Tetracycline resistance MFS efflux pump n=1 Tax=Chondromyces crocatus TaxID=52 RepID=A0A0K1EQJ6_CHOCO|nr:MFS transporter [Chondromyces crocatus]AKT43106.1 tetracycline resistance MFS efflux pump [Chondromyces crocatus]
MRSPLLPIFLTIFVDVFGMTMIIPVLPFFAQHLGASEVVTGALLSTYAACQLVSGPILGRISDRVGRKPTLLASQFGTMIGFLVLGSSTSLWMLFLARVISGATAGNLTVAQAYIADVTSPENRTRAFGMVGVAFGTGFLVGPALSGELAERYGYGVPGLVAAGLSLLSIVLTSTLLPARKPLEVPPQEGRLGAFQRMFQRATPRRRLLEFFFFSLSFATLTGGLSFYLQRRFSFTMKNVGHLYAFSGLVGGMVQGGFIGRMAKKMGEHRLALGGFVLMMVGYACLGALFTLPALLAVVAVSSIGSAVVRPALTTLLTKSVGPHEQGAVLGVSQSLSCMALITGPLLANSLIGRGELAAYGIAAAVFAAAGVLLGAQPPPAEITGS